MPVTGMAAAERDAVLIERTARGDRAAFEELYRRFARPVLAMARRQLGDTGRAEDATQETFAAVWRSARSYREERGSASAWLYAVARHAIIDRALQRIEPAAEAPDEATADAGPDELPQIRLLDHRRTSSRRDESRASPARVRVFTVPSGTSR